MQTRSDMELELQQRLMTANNSGMVPPVRLTQLIQDACSWAGSLFFWPPLQRARQTTAAKNTQSLMYDYYDYPSDFLTDSISRIYIDGQKYFPKAFQDMLDYSDSSNQPLLAPNAQNKFFANYGRQYFIFPSYNGTPTTGNLLVWGSIQHPPLINSTSQTIFSLWDDSGNEAIVKKAMAVALKRLDPSIAAAEEQDAIGILQVMWKKVTDEAQRSQRLNHPFFNVPDFFGFGSGMSTMGNFNISVDITNEF